MSVESMSLRPDQVAWRKLVERWNSDERAHSATIDCEDGSLMNRASCAEELEMVASVHSTWGRTTLVFRLPGIGDAPRERIATRAWALIDEFGDEGETFGFVKADGLEGLARILEVLAPFEARVVNEPDVAG